MAWPKTECANPKCRHLIPAVVFLCWTCWLRVPQQLRNRVEAARVAMSGSFTTEKLNEYRAARSAAVSRFAA